MPTPLARRLDHPGLLLGVVRAEGVTPAPGGPGLDAAVDALVAARAGTDFPPPDLRKAVRDVLRAGGFKPTGRNKPASEYLARAADRGAFPRIVDVVDAANLHSLDTGLPISLLDLDRALSGAGDDGLEVRFGARGESFVFNPAGQEIDVSGLPVIARAGGAALGNAVKDSMETKVRPDTRRVLAVLWIPRAVLDEDAARATTRRLAARLEDLGGAASTEASLLPPATP